MFDKILVALDGSDHAKHALTMSVELATRCESELTVFHAIQYNPFRSDYDVCVAKTAREVFEKIGREQADSILDEAEQYANQKGVTKLIRTVGEGDPVKAILKAVENHPIDLVVIGTRGMSGLREISMGSVAHKISVASPTPVLVVKQTRESYQGCSKGKY